MPDFYHRITNARHRGELVELCNQLGLTRSAVEVGVFRGGFSRHNLKTWKGEKYYMVDAWGFRANDTTGEQLSLDKNGNSTEWNERNYQMALDAVKEFLPPLGNRAVILRRFAESVVNEFSDGEFDFVYIDAGHEYRNVMRDLRMWWPKLRLGGMFAGDDFADMTDTFSTNRKEHSGAGWGVKSAVATFAREVGSPFFLTFADHSHVTTEMHPRRSREFGAENLYLPHYLNNYSLRELPPLEHRVRAQSFYPAWYMFK